MFCTKCGLDAGDSKFCPRCGAPVTAGESQHMTDMPQEQSGGGTAAPQEPAANTYDGGTQNLEQEIAEEFIFTAAPGMAYVKQKKKWPKILAIAAVIVLLLGTGTYFAYPYISEAVSPKKQAAAALKNAAAGFEALISNAVSGTPATTPAAAKHQSKGTMKLESLKIAGKDYLSDLKVDTFYCDVQMDAAAGEFGGTAGLSAGSGAPVLSYLFYTDSTYLYFQLPELFEQNYRIDLSGEVGAPFGEYMEIMQAMYAGGNTQSLSQYAGVIEAAVKSCVKGFNTMVDNFEYKKTGTQELEADGLRVKAAAYEVTVTADSLSKGMNAAVDALYEDKELSTYMSMISALTGYSKDVIKNTLALSLNGMRDFTFTMYVKDHRIVGLDVDLSRFDKSMDGIIELRLPGDKSSEYVRLKLADDDMEMTVKYDGRGDNVIFAVELVPDQNVYPGDYLNLNLDMRVSGNRAQLNRSGFEGKMDGVDMELKLSVDSTTEPFSGMGLSASQFTGALDLERLTREQGEKLLSDLEENFSVLQSLLSDSLYEELLNDFHTLME